MQISTSIPRSPQLTDYDGAAPSNEPSQPQGSAELSSGVASLVRSAGPRGTVGVSGAEPDAVGAEPGLASIAREVNGVGRDASALDELGVSPLEFLGDGLRGIGAAIADFFSFTGSAISTFVEAVFVTNAVVETIGNAGSRIADALRGLWTGGRDAVVGIYRNTSEAISTMTRGLTRIGSGDLAGLGDVGLGLVKVVQTPIDAALLVGGRAVSAVQTLAALEPVGRELEVAEQRTLRSIFGDSVDLSAIRLKEGQAGVFSATSRPFAHGNTIYMQAQSGMTALVHEATHVWQHQNGGTDYMTEAVTAQLSLGDAAAYDWRAAVGTQSWAELNPEQQAALVESAFIDGAFERSPPAFSNVRLPDGMSLTELNDYLRRALFEIKNGRGAP